MRLPSASLPRSQFTTPPDVEDGEMVSLELFPEIDVHSVAADCREMLHDPSPAASPSTVLAANIHTAGQTAWLHENFDFIHLGWARAFSRLEAVCRASYLMQHRRHSSPKLSCLVCNDHLTKAAHGLALHTIELVASEEAEGALGATKIARTCVKENGVWVATRRLEKEGLLQVEDLDFSPFFDSVSIKKVAPVIYARSRLFYALAIYTHFREMAHAGVEAVLNRISQQFYPLGDARHQLLAIKKSCSKCRITLKKVVGMELADVHPMRTVIAPPFYAVMADIAMGFKAKPTATHRKCFNANALVVVCLLTSATSILVLDGLDTQAVVMALERHASRYGIPGHVFVDAGTQLEKLKSTEFALRDLSGRIATSKRFSVTVATPKAHEQQGRVEAKIKIIRRMLQVFSDTTREVHTLLGWETLFSRIADHIDNLPISRGSQRAATDLGWEIITPNRLKLGRNNFRQLEGNIILHGGPQNLLDRSRLLQERWYTLFIARVHLLVPGPAKPTQRVLQAGDVVVFIFKDAAIPKLETWRLGVVNRQVSRSTFEIRYSSESGKQRLICRSARQITLVYGDKEIPPTSLAFFER